MSRLDLEYFYLSGLPIDVRHKQLGIIHQPKLIEFINSGLEMSTFSHPFILNKEMIMNRNEDVDNALEGLGRLKFLVVYDSFTTKSKNGAKQEGVMDLLKKSLALLYKTEDIVVMETLPAIVIGKDVLITDDNFEYLSNLIIEMLRIDIREMRKRIEEERKRAKEEENEDSILKKFRQKEKEYNEKVNKGQDENSFFDVINVVIHSQGVIDYEKVFNMTVYQLKNSYSTIIKKEVYNASLMHRISPNFQPTEDFKLWEEKSCVVKSGLNKN